MDRIQRFGGPSSGQERIERGGDSGTLNAVSDQDEITSGFACWDYRAVGSSDIAGCRMLRSAISEW